MRLPAWLPALLLLAALASHPAVAQELRYRAELAGEMDSGLEDKVRAASRLLSLADEPAPSLVALHRRGDEDLERVQAVLRAEGRYDAQVRVDYDEAADPPKVTLTVQPGPEYRIQSFQLLLAAPPAEVAPEVSLDQLGVELGEPARSETVVKAEAAALVALSRRGFPLAKISDRHIVVDHDAHAMRVELLAETGPLARFGPVAVEGLSGLDEGWVRRRIPWSLGQRFDVDLMDRFRNRLQSSGLFSSVKLSTAQAVVEGGLLPVTVSLAERDIHSVGVGANWSSSEGFGGNAYWEDRNLFGGAERLRLSAIASEIRNAVEAEFRTPDIVAPDWDLVTNAAVEEQRTKAYLTRTARVGTGLDYPVAETWRGFSGVRLERTFSNQFGQERYFTLVSLPLEARHDSSDNLLDPTTGSRATLGLQPFVGTTVRFNRLDLYDTQYVKLWDKPRVVAAGWARLGTIQGARIEDIPGDKRFYMGGAGSVRAFGFQKAGPVDSSGDPTGGVSALGLGGELRFRASDTIGVVPFVEGGRAYASRLPDLSQTLFWGGGVGLRYITPVGPVRADVAVPMNRRSGIDDPFQIYLSLGQAF